MEARYLWTGCQFDSPMAGPTNVAAPIDCFWVTVEVVHVNTLIKPYADELQWHRYYGKAHERDSDRFSPDGTQTAFLVARDKSRIITTPWNYPQVEPLLVAIGEVGPDGLPAGTAITSLDDLAAL